MDIQPAFINPSLKQKIKDYLIEVCKVKNPEESDIIETYRSLYYLGKAVAEFKKSASASKR